MDESDRDERTIFVGGLPEKATEGLLFELFYQAGELEHYFLDFIVRERSIKTM